MRQCVERVWSGIYGTHLRCSRKEDDVAEVPALQLFVILRSMDPKEESDLVFCGEHLLQRLSSYRTPFIVEAIP
jgi:hypothetical protein